VRDSQADITRARVSPVGPADDVRGALERVIGGFLDLYERDAVIMRTWLQARGRSRASATCTARRGRCSSTGWPSNVTLAVAASGRADGPPAETVASALVSMVEHFAYCWVVLGESHERDDALSSLVLGVGRTLNALAGFEAVELDTQDP
jgi:hypothetical protein